MRRGWKIFGLSLLMTGLISGAVYAGQGVGVVQDDADLLETYQERELAQTAQTMAEENGFDFMVVTTDYARGKSSRDYAEQFYVDHESAGSGIVYLLDLDNGELYVTPVDEMNRYITDDRYNEIMDSGIERAREKQYFESFQIMLEDTQKYINAGIPEDQYYVQETGPKEKKLSPIEALIALLGGLGTFGGIFGSVNSRYKMKTGGYQYDFRANSNLNLSVNTDQFENRFITRRPLPKEPPRTGGGGGHSSTVHTGAGGHSFGGGGRKL